MNKVIFKKETKKDLSKQNLRRIINLLLKNVTLAPELKAYYKSVVKKCGLSTGTYK